jgi:hypothetical protein
MMRVRTVAEADAPVADGIASAAEAYGFVGWVVSTASYGASRAGFRVDDHRAGAYVPTQ